MRKTGEPSVRAMVSDAPKPRKARRTEVLIAAIGVVGTVATGMISNWDKLYPDTNVVQAAVVGYAPTSNFETELRYFLEVSGMRAMLEVMPKSLFAAFKNDLIEKDPGSAAEIIQMIDLAEKEAIRFDEVVSALLPLYQRYFTVAELQELNRFYSTKVMQDMVKKAPSLMQDAAPIQVELMQKGQERFMERVRSIKARAAVE